MKHRLFDIGRFIIAVGCFYEIVAIPHKTPFPTITNLLHGAQRSRSGKVFFAAWLGFWLHHFVRLENYRTKP